MSKTIFLTRDKGSKVIYGWERKPYLDGKGEWSKLNIIDAASGCCFTMTAKEALTTFGAVVEEGGMVYFQITIGALCSE